MDRQGFTGFHRRPEGLIDSAAHPMSTLETPNQEAPGEAPVWSIGTGLLFVVLWVTIQLLAVVLFSVAAMVVLMLVEGVDQETAAARLQADPSAAGQLVLTLAITVLSWIVTFALMQRMLRRWSWPVVLKALGVVAPQPRWVWALTPVV